MSNGLTFRCNIRVGWEKHKIDVGFRATLTGRECKKGTLYINMYKVYWLGVTSSNCHRHGSFPLADGPLALLSLVVNISSFGYFSNIFWLSSIITNASYLHKNM